MKSAIVTGPRIKITLLNQVRAWFLKIDMVRMSVCVCVYLCVRPPPPAPPAIKNYSREMKPE